MDNETPLPLLKGIHSLRDMIKHEIEKEREQQRRLRGQGARGWLTITILVSCVLLNFVLLFSEEAYPVNFIIASFYLLMFYFLTLLIPLDARYRGHLRLEVVSSLKKLKSLGIIKSTERLSRVFLNAFLINCRPLFFGFFLIFSLDIVFAFSVFSGGNFPSATGWMVIFQSLVIIVFYFLVWWLEPYSTEFFSDILNVKKQLVRNKIPSRFVSIFLWTGAALALIGVFSTVILLPGFTLSGVMSISGLEHLGDLVFSIGILVFCQYFIIRYLHGITSRHLAERFSEMKTHSLSRQIKTEGISPAQNGAAGELPEFFSTDAAREAACVLLESRIYQLEERTIFKAFPVYIVNPDFSVMLNKNALDELFRHVPLPKQTDR